MHTLLESLEYPELLLGTMRRCRPIVIPSASL